MQSIHLDVSPVPLPVRFGPVADVERQVARVRAEERLWEDYHFGPILPGCKDEGAEFVQTLEQVVCDRRGLDCRDAHHTTAGSCSGALHRLGNTMHARVGLETRVARRVEPPGRGVVLAGVGSLWPVLYRTNVHVRNAGHCGDGDVRDARVQQVGMSRVPPGAGVRGVRRRGERLERIQLAGDGVEWAGGVSGGVSGEQRGDIDSGQAKSCGGGGPATREGRRMADRSKLLSVSVVIWAGEDVLGLCVGESTVQRVYRAEQRRTGETRNGVVYETV